MSEIFGGIGFLLRIVGVRVMVFNATFNNISIISWTKWKSEATNPFLALRVYVKMSEIHKTDGVWHKI